MSDLINKANSVNDQSSLAEFVKELADEFTRNPDGWENGDLESFLRSMSSWIKDMDGYYKNTGQSYTEKHVSWKNFADILLASTMYE
jgi:hypothetical protein